MFRTPLCPSSGAQELYRWLLPVVLGALVYRSLVCCGAVGYVSGLCDQTNRIPKGLVKIYQISKHHSLHMERRTFHRFAMTFILQIDAAGRFEKLVNGYQNTRCHNYR